MSGQRVRWGILGVADILRRVLPGARLAPSAELLAIASRNVDRARMYAAAEGIPRVHASYDELLADPDVEAVYIPLPNSLHHEWTLTALAAGKHVLCEKPYSRHPDEVIAAFDAADRAGLLLMEAFMWRHHPRTKQFVKLLPEIGELQTIRTTFSWKMEPGRVDIRLEPGLDGGGLMDVGCYCVSAARLIAGTEPIAAHGEQVVGPSGVDIRFTGLLRFPGDVIAEFTSGFTTDHEGIEAIGSDGSITVGDPWTSKVGSITVNGRGVPLEAADAYHHEFENFSRAIQGHEPQLLGRDDALGQSRTIEALYRSADTGVAVDLSPTVSA